MEERGLWFEVTEHQPVQIAPAPLWMKTADLIALLRKHGSTVRVFPI
ncbi:MAG: hypothetical protein HFF12_02065 [Angelakisella sp.]|nr:hypothetical protein [Angelakisella sp.]